MGWKPDSLRCRTITISLKKIPTPMNPKKLNLLCPSGYHPGVLLEWTFKISSLTLLDNYPAVVAKYKSGWADARLVLSNEPWASFTKKKE